MRHCFRGIPKQSDTPPRTAPIMNSVLTSYKQPGSSVYTDPGWPSVSASAPEPPAPGESEGTAPKGFPAESLPMLTRHCQ